MSESDWTQLLLKYGYAVLADSEIRDGNGAEREAPTRRAETVGRTPASSTSPEIDHVRGRPPGDHGPRVKARPAPTTERRHALRELAYKMTGKRSTKP